MAAADGSGVEAALKRAGLRLTPQRYDVLEYLARRRVHATADEIYAAVNRTNPRLSRATVYNSLRALVKAGLVREVSGEGSAARFDANLERHHHFICDQCGAIEDIDWFELPGHLRSRALGARTIRDVEVTFRGLCSRCGR